MTTAPQSTHPIMYMSVFPSPTFSPSKAVMSSGGMEDPTFQVMMCTLVKKGCFSSDDLLPCLVSSILYFI